MVRVTCTALPSPVVPPYAPAGAAWCLSWRRPAPRPCCTVSQGESTGQNPWQDWSGTMRATCMAPLQSVVPFTVVWSSSWIRAERTPCCTNSREERTVQPQEQGEDWSGTMRVTCTALPTAGVVPLYAPAGAAWCLSWRRPARRPCCTGSGEERMGHPPPQGWSETVRATCMVLPLWVVASDGGGRG